MKLAWSESAWQDYIDWQNSDKKIAKRINQLIKDIMRHPFDGIGSPEPLRHGLAGCWSRRITREHRLVYQCTKEAVYIFQCRYHY